MYKMCHFNDFLCLFWTFTQCLKIFLNDTQNHRYSNIPIPISCDFPLPIKNSTPFSGRRIPEMVARISSQGPTYTPQTPILRLPGRSRDSPTSTNNEGPLGGGFIVNRGRNRLFTLYNIDAISSRRL